MNKIEFDTDFIYERVTKMLFTHLKSHGENRCNRVIDEILNKTAKDYWNNLSELKKAKLIKESIKETLNRYTIRDLEKYLKIINKPIKDVVKIKELEDAHPSK